jgi:hypothetical protein
MFPCAHRIRSRHGFDRPDTNIEEAVMPVAGSMPVDARLVCILGHGRACEHAFRIQSGHRVPYWQRLRYPAQAATNQTVSGDQYTIAP